MNAKEKMMTMNVLAIMQTKMNMKNNIEANMQLQLNKKMWSNPSSMVAGWASKSSER
jgi:hypothetical protein